MTLRSFARPSLALAAAAVGVLLGTELTDGPTPHAITPAITSALSARAISIETDAPGSGLDDLAGLRTAIGDARIVALGEATHGTREFFRMKHRIVAMLARERGTVLFAIEANMPECEAINRYVLTGEGSARAAMAGIYFWTWNTEEVLALIEWMRATNASGAARIEFRGFDMQEPTVALGEVMTFINRFDTGYVDDAREDYFTLVTATQMAGSFALSRYDDELVQWRRAAARLQARLWEERSRLQRVAGTKAHAWALQCAGIVVDAIDLYGRESYDAFNRRDRAMARNVEWLVAGAPRNAVVVLWAHNGHVARRLDGIRTMGSHLSRRFGDSLVVVGFAFGDGEYMAYAPGPPGDAWELRPNPSGAPHPGSIEAALRAAGRRIFALDLRRARGGSDALAFLDEPWPHRTIGAVAIPPEHEFEPQNLSRAYDLLIYIDRTTPSRTFPENHRR